MVIWLARLLAGVCRVWPTGNRLGALIIPPAGPGSLGDEAMIEGVAGALAERGQSPINVVARIGKESWPSIDHVDGQLQTPAGILGRLIWFILQSRKHAFVFVVGADCIDGHYSVHNSVQLLLLADLAARSGATSTLLGSSYKSNAHTDTAWMLRTMSPRVRLCARDPISGQRMRDASGREPLVVADAAFLLRSATISPDLMPTADWIEQQHNDGRVVLGVNFNRQVIKGEHGQARERLFESYAEALSAIGQDRSVSILFIPHDYRGEQSDLSQGQELCRRLGERLGDRVACVPGRQSPGRLKAIASRVDAVLTGRMHFAIASLGKHTPVACISYQGKFEGLMQHFALDGVLMSPDDASDPDRLRKLIHRLLEDRSKLHQAIKERLPSVQAMSLLNLPEELREANE